MRSFGGFLELEAKNGNHYHSNSFALNSGRNALKTASSKIAPFKRYTSPISFVRL